jgi:hypothetical protein
MAFKRELSLSTAEKKQQGTFKIVVELTEQHATVH